MVTIAGTGSFRPVSPVVFINVEEGFEECVDLHEKLQHRSARAELPFAYHPHVTIAHDVAPESLDEAETVLKDTGPPSLWLAWDFTSTTPTAFGSYGKSLTLGPKLTTTPAPGSTPPRTHPTAEPAASH
jgi:hypothetical protein